LRFPNFLRFLLNLIDSVSDDFADSELLSLRVDVLSSGLEDALDSGLSNFTRR
jgi:hypothetical protein